MPSAYFVILQLRPVKFTSTYKRMFQRHAQSACYASVALITILNYTSADANKKFRQPLRAVWLSMTGMHRCQTAAFIQADGLCIQIIVNHMQNTHANRTHARTRALVLHIDNFKRLSLLHNWISSSTMNKLATIWTPQGKHTHTHTHTQIQIYLQCTRERSRFDAGCMMHTVCYFAHKHAFRCVARRASDQNMHHIRCITSSIEATSDGSAFK